MAGRTSPRRSLKPPIDVAAYTIDGEMPARQGKPGLEMVEACTRALLREGLRRSKYNGHCREHAAPSWVSAHVRFRPAHFVRAFHQTAGRRLCPLDWRLGQFTSARQPVALKTVFNANGQALPPAVPPASH